MRILRKDGGPKSHVWGYYFIELKELFSIVLLRFEHGSREAFHTHAFAAVSWLLWGKLQEQILDDSGLVADVRYYRPSLWPIITPHDCFHKVIACERSWALSFRGPWRDTWRERDESRRFLVLTHGRREVM